MEIYVNSLVLLAGLNDKVPKAANSDTTVRPPPGGFETFGGKIEWQHSGFTRSTVKHIRSKSINRYSLSRLWKIIFSARIGKVNKFIRFWNRKFAYRTANGDVCQ